MQLTVMLLTAMQLMVMLLMAMQLMVMLLMAMQPAAAVRHSRSALLRSVMNPTGVLPLPNLARTYSLLITDMIYSLLTVTMTLLHRSKQSVDLSSRLWITLLLTQSYLPDGIPY